MVKEERCCKSGQREIALKKVNEVFIPPHLGRSRWAKDYGRIAFNDIVMSRGCGAKLLV